MKYQHTKGKYFVVIHSKFVTVKICLKRLVCMVKFFMVQENPEFPFGTQFHFSRTFHLNFKQILLQKRLKIYFRKC